MVKLVVATGYAAEWSTKAILCPSYRSGDRPHSFPPSGVPPTSVHKHTIFLKLQHLIESDSLAKNSENPEKGLQLLYTGEAAYSILLPFTLMTSLLDLSVGGPAWKSKNTFWNLKYYLHALFFCGSHREFKKKWEEKPCFLKQ